MRVVALYFHRIAAGPGGAERMVLQLGAGLAARGLGVHLVTWDDPTSRSFYPLPTSIAWHPLGFGAGVADKVRRAYALADVLRAHNVDVLVGFVMSGDKTVYAGARLAGVRLVAAERNAPSMYWLRYGPLQRWLIFALLHLCDAIAVQSVPFVLGYPRTLRSRIRVIPNPVRRAVEAARPGEPDSRGRYTLLALGRLDSVQKGLDVLINAFQQVAQELRQWDLRIVGEGPARSELLALIEERGLFGRVRVAPATARVSAEYAGAQLFAIPSRWEGFPNALAEALASGLPAVGFSQAAGVNQLISDGETGWLATGLGDAESLAATLRGAMCDHAARMRRGANAMQAMGEYTEQRALMQWEGLLIDLGKKRRRRG